MATRATYKFKTGYTTATAYIHWDGYLQGAAHYFNEALTLRGDSKRDLFSCFIWANDEATMTDGHEAHGDTEFQYDIERREGKFQIKAYKRVSYTSEEFRLVFIGTLEDFVTQYLINEGRLSAATEEVMKKKPMARTLEQVRRDKRREFLEDLFWSACAVFFMVVGGYALAGAWLGL